MASGSQVCSGNWALLPTTPRNRQQAPTSNRRWLMSPSSASWLRWAMLKLPFAAKKSVMMPIIKPMSPVRVVRNAFTAASELSFSSHQ